MEWGRRLRTRRGVVDTTDIEQRIARLEELSRGLGKEVVLWKAADDPLLYLERPTPDWRSYHAVWATDGPRPGAAPQGAGGPTTTR
jgi:hypothetical protein